MRAISSIVYIIFIIYRYLIFPISNANVGLFFFLFFLGFEDYLKIEESTIWNCTFEVSLKVYRIRFMHSEVMSECFTD